MPGMLRLDSLLFKNNLAIAACLFMKSRFAENSSQNKLCQAQLCKASQRLILASRFLNEVSTASIQSKAILVLNDTEFPSPRQKCLYAASY